MRSPSWALAGLSLCMLLPSLGISIANVALPTLAATFAASFREVQWVVLAYLLATTTLIVSVGRLGDITGRRNLLIAGIVLFAVASVVCALAPALWLLIAGRVVQGAAAAVLMALSIALVGEVVPKARTGSAMGLLGTMSALGTALGPSLGGVLVAGFGWQAIFWLTAALAPPTLLLAQRGLPGGRHKMQARRTAFDHRGTWVLALTLLAYALAMTLGRGSFGVRNLGLLLVAALGLGLFVWVEAKAVSPLIRLSKLRDPALRTSLVTSALVSTVMMATLVVGPFYLAHGLGLGTALIGLTMAVGPLVAALTGIPAGRLVDRFGAARMILGGLVATAIGCSTLCLMPAALGLVGYVAPIAVMTAGYALFQAANNTAVMADVPADQRGAISGLLNLSRNLGLISGASVMGTVFAWASGTADFTTVRSDAVATGMRISFAIAALLIIIALASAAASLKRLRGRGDAIRPTLAFADGRQTAVSAGRQIDESSERRPS